MLARRTWQEDILLGGGASEVLGASSQAFLIAGFSLPATPVVQAKREQ